MPRENSSTACSSPLTLDDKPEFILVVDDEPDDREALCELCRLRGYSVTDAENGLAALELIRSGFSPSLILLDLRMPVMDGYAFLHHARQDSHTRNVPIIVITADLAAHPSHTDAILRKPIDPEVLLRFVGWFVKPAS